MENTFRNNILDKFRKVKRLGSSGRIVIGMLPLFQGLSPNDTALMKDTIKEMEAEGIISIENNHSPRLILMVLTEYGKEFL